MKKLLATLSVILFADQAVAENVKLETGDVYYCVQTAAFHTDAISGSKILELDLKKFTLKLTDEYLIMKDHSGITELPIITRIETNVHVRVQEGNYMFSLTVHKGKIYFSSATVWGFIATMNRGECDKFP